MRDQNKRLNALLMEFHKKQGKGSSRKTSGWSSGFDRKPCLIWGAMQVAEPKQRSGGGNGPLYSKSTCFHIKDSEEQLRQIKG